MGKLPAAAGVLGLTLAAACAPTGEGNGNAAISAPPAAGPDAKAQPQPPESADPAGPQPGRTRESNRHARDRNARDQ